MRSNKKTKDAEAPATPSFIRIDNQTFVVGVFIVLALGEMLFNTFHNMPFTFQDLLKYVVGQSLYAIYIRDGENKQILKSIFSKLEVVEYLEKEMQDLRGQLRMVTKVAISQQLYEQPEVMKKAIEEMVGEIVEKSLRTMVRSIMDEITNETQAPPLPDLL